MGERFSLIIIKYRKNIFWKCRLHEAPIYFQTRLIFWNSKSGRECKTVEMEVIVADEKLGATLMKKDRKNGSILNFTQIGKPSWKTPQVPPVNKKLFQQYLVRKS